LISHAEAGLHDVKIYLKKCHEFVTRKLLVYARIRKTKDFTNVGNDARA